MFDLLSDIFETIRLRGIHPWARNAGNGAETAPSPGEFCRRAFRPIATLTMQSAMSLHVDPRRPNARNVCPLRVAADAFGGCSWERSLLSLSSNCTSGAGSSARGPKADPPRRAPFQASSKIDRGNNNIARLSFILSGTASPARAANANARAN
jgi:hypothetical protein